MNKKTFVVTVSSKYEDIVKQVEEISDQRGNNKFIPTLFEMVKLGVAAYGAGYRISDGEIVKKINIEDGLNL